MEELAQTEDLVSPEQCEDFKARLPKALRELAVSVPRESGEHFNVALNVCARDTLPKFRADLRLCLEACKIADLRQPSDIKFLITEDYLKHSSGAVMWRE